jgi:hypothetical protein
MLAEIGEIALEGIVPPGKTHAAVVAQVGVL